MSGLPPLSAEPGTPAHEWAAKTTSALDPNPPPPAAHTLNPTTRQLFEEKNLRPGTTADAPAPLAPLVPPEERTPSQDIPGAFPDREELQARGAEVVGAASEAAARVAQTVQETAAAYLPRAAETVGAYLPKSVVDTVSGYIPGMTNPQGVVAASEHDMMHRTSLPTTELTGHAAGEHVGGAGALPGPVTESGVTRLPDEREGAWQVPTAAGAAAAATATAAAAAAAASSAAQSTAEQAKGAAYGTAEQVKGAAYGTAEQVKAKSTAIVPGPVSGLATTKYSMPTEEESGAKPGEHVDGVGALPGKRTEAGVATLPDENMRGATNATSTSVGTHARTFGAATLPSQDSATGVSGGVGALPGKAGEEGVAVLPDERAGAGAAFGAGVAAASMPTRETTGAQPGERSGGAGALPGSNTESGVALPPDEKAGAGSGLAKHVGEDTAMAEAAKKAGAGTQAPSSSKSTSTAPTSEKKPTDTTGHKGLPNKRTWPRDPLPDARGDGSAHDQAPEPERDEEDEQAEGRERELRANLLVPNLRPRTHVLGSEGAQWMGVDVGSDGYKRGAGVDIDHGDGYDTDYHPAAMHPLDADYSKEHAEQEKEKEPAAEKDGEKPLTGAKHADSKQASHAEGTGSATEHDDDHKAKKAGFMAKMKGEAKILIGKMEGKKGAEKVEEGQRLKAGEPVQ